MRRGFAFLLPICLAGCYGYYPQSPSTAPAGRDLLVHLTDSGSFVLTRVVGPSVAGVQGRVVSDTAGRVILSVSSIRLRDGTENDWKGESIAIPHALIATTTERRFSRARTTLFSGAVAIALVALRQAFGGQGSGIGGSTSGTTGPK